MASVSSFMACLNSPTASLRISKRSSRLSFGEESPVPPGKLSGSSPACGCNIGSVGHPGLCNRPCIQFARGECTAGAQCNFCHMSHGTRTPHLDKRHRELLNRLSFGQRVALALPIVRRQVSKLGVAVEAQELIASMESAACQSASDARMKRESTSLTSALGALSLRALMTAVCKASDTPDWLKVTALEEQLERIRLAEQLRARR
mmetsp:Transcript_15404/g.40866  ORF Transcript_15404/g.40866 Transcript_15404/m.40866 type:complete len:205 (-) Transcript_15404:177-791(-)